MNDSRLLTCYSSSSSLMLYSCCSTSILNMTIASMGFRPALFFLGLSWTCSKIGRNYHDGTLSYNFINRVFLLSNFWYRCSSSPTFFLPWRFNPSFCSPYTLILRATCSIFRGARILVDFFSPQEIARKVEEVLNYPKDMHEIRKQAGDTMIRK